MVDVKDILIGFKRKKYTDLLSVQLYSSHNTNPIIKMIKNQIYSVETFWDQFKSFSNLVDWIIKFYICRFIALALKFLRLNSKIYVHSVMYIQVKDTTYFEWLNFFTLKGIYSTFNE